MPSEHWDAIHIRDLKVECILGVYDEERHRPRPVIFNITLYFPGPSPAVNGDNFERALDYSAVSERIVQVIGLSSFRLIESLAEAAAAELLSVPGTAAVHVIVDKPGVPENARAAAVEIYREAVLDAPGGPP